MTTTPQNKEAHTPKQPRVFQTPPLLEPEISGAEQAAGNGPALRFAKRISASAALVAGALGGGLFTLAAAKEGATQLGLKVFAGAGGGTLLGYLISAMPWHQVQKHTSPRGVPEPAADLAMASPVIPQAATVPPTMAVMETEHSGTVGVSPSHVQGM